MRRRSSARLRQLQELLDRYESHGQQLPSCAWHAPC